MVKATFLAFIISFVPVFSINAAALPMDSLISSKTTETSMVDSPHKTAQNTVRESLDPVFQETEWETEWATENLETEEIGEQRDDEKGVHSEKLQDEKDEPILETEKEKSLVEKSKERFKLSDLLIQIGSGILLFVIPYGIVVNKKKKR